jgi:hypothetical protein
VCSDGSYGSSLILQDPDDLVCEILEMQMDMDCKGIDYSSSSVKLKICFDGMIWRRLSSAYAKSFGFRNLDMMQIHGRRN